MISEKHKIVLAVTGASGSIYAKVLFDKISKLGSQIENVGLIMSDNAKEIWKMELGNEDYKNVPFQLFEKSDFSAPFASGSAKYNTMIVCPCSMGTLARIATGISNDLTTRAADVILKERRKLILVTRDTPLSLIHLNNMTTLTQAGATICPAVPSFYSKPKNFEELAATVIDRVIDLADLQHHTFRWSE